MKTLYIEAHRNISLNEEKLNELNKILPDTIYIAYSIQYKSLAEQVQKKLKKKITGFSQVLGCSRIKTNSDILLIGDGMFHALNLAFSTAREVYIFNNNTIEQINKEEIEQYNAREKGKYAKFLMSDKAGILVSLKPGQENLNQALKLKEQLKKQNKQAYLFLADNIHPAEFENFSLPIYINTACPGLELDNRKIIGYQKIIK